jgi:PAS domain S-box-containing protein
MNPTPSPSQFTDIQATILDALPAHIALIDAQGVILAVNESWRRFALANHLQTPDFAVGRNYLHLCESATGDCSGEANLAASGIRRVLAGEIPEFSLDYPCHSPTEPRWFRLMITPLSQTGLSGAVVMHINVTEQTLAGDALRESEARFRGTFEQAAVGIAHVSLQGRFHRVNDKLCSILGHSREELLQLAFDDLIVPEDRDEAFEVRRAILAGERSTFTTEKRYRHEDGKVVWANLVTTLQRTPDGEPKYFISVFEDITQRKLAEFRLHRLNRLHTVLSRTGEAAVRNPNRLELLADICRIVVADGRLRLAIIVEIDEPSGSIRQVAAYGEGLPYLDDLKVTLDGPLGQGTIGTALRTGRHDLCNDFANDPRMAPWRQRALHFGFLSTASFPLTIGSLTIGTLTLFSGEAGYFHNDEIHLMSSVADTVSFALEGLRKEQDRQKTEAALRASESNMAAAQQIAHFGSWELDLTHPLHPDSTPLRWSDEMFRIAGLAPGSVAVTRNLFFSLVPPDEQDEIRSAVAAAIQNRTPYSIVHRLVRPNGEIRFVREAAQLIFDPSSGHPLKMIGTAHDITLQRAAEADLRESEERFRLLAKASHAAIWDWNMIADSLSWNEGVSTLFGYPPEDIEPNIRFCLGRIHPDDLDAVDAIVRHAFACGAESWTADYRFRHRDGRYIPVRDCGYILRDSSGQPIRMIGGMTDLSERRQAEARIAEQAALIDQAHDAIILRDLDHLITFWNKGAERIFGWTAAEACGQPFHDLVRVEPDRFSEANRAVRSKGEWNGEIQQFTKSNSKLIFASRWTLLRDPRGEPRAILSIDSDITERKRLEQRFLRAQRMESIGTLAGGIAHDLNNALVPILMSVDLLKLDLSSSERARTVSTIESSARRCAEMVSQVLSFARGFEGRKSIVQPKYLLSEIQKLASDTFPKNIRILTHIDPNLWSVTGDSTQLHQVLLNLCVNARDAMPGGGSLSLSSSNILLDHTFTASNSEALPGPHVLIQVQDDGIGIPPETIDKIFDPFFTTKEVGKGTGLGLSTSLAIIQSHGGFLRVYSEPGRGSTFQVYLPAHTTQHSDDLARHHESLPRGKGELILVIDDESSVLQITRQTLETFGYRVMLAQDGAQAIALYVQNKHDIALVLTDMMMPVMDGPATIQVLVKLNPLIRLIATSGISSNAHVAQVASAGLTHFLPKPYTAETLLRLLRRVLDEKSSPAASSPR